jgi:hypothetical protein
MEEGISMVENKRIGKQISRVSFQLIL